MYHFNLPAPPISVATTSVTSMTLLQVIPLFFLPEGMPPALVTLSRSSRPANVLPLFSPAPGRFTIKILSSKRNNVQWSDGGDELEEEGADDTGGSLNVSSTSIQSMYLRELEKSPGGKPSIEADRQ